MTKIVANFLDSVCISSSRL